MTHALQSLTRREREVVARIAIGESNSAIAAALGIGDKTVYSHRANAQFKLGVRNRSAITLIAIREGLISMHDVASEDSDAD